jgi:hypothetical protein
MIDINRHIEMFLLKTALILAAVYSPFEFGQKKFTKRDGCFMCLHDQFNNHQQQLRAPLALFFNGTR